MKIIQNNNFLQGNFQHKNIPIQLNYYLFMHATASLCLESFIIINTTNQLPTISSMVVCKSQKALAWGLIPSIGRLLSCVVEKKFDYV